VAYISDRYNCVAEIGIGHFPDVAMALAKSGVYVLATDVKPFEHAGFRVVLDDIMDPDLHVYTGLDLIYSLRPPPELVPHMNQLAKTLSADLIIKPLASEHPGGKLTRHRSSTFFLWEFS
jgi:uncharacterized UPF0146 family protein